MSSKGPSQSLIRRTLFWSHLVAGVAAGIVIFTLALTGVLLTYEAQIKGLFAFKITDATDHSQMLSADELIAIAQPIFPGQTASLTYYRDPSKPMAVAAGRRNVKLHNPYNGELIKAEKNPAQDFFGFIEQVHRTLAGERGGTGADIVKAANLAFFFLLLSGIYLWLPRKWKWSFLKPKILFTKMPTARARDFNWHHVLSFWMVLPLLVIVWTGAVFSYDWAAKVTYNSVGLEAPVHGKRPQSNRSAGGQPTTSKTQLVSYQAIVEQARSTQEDWQSLSITLPHAANAKNVQILIDRGNGKQASTETKLTYSRETGEIEKVQDPSSVISSTQSLRRYIRFLHTGEVYGIIGQTLAGLASLATLILVWTGLALAWRRLINPLFRQKAKPTATPMAG